MTAKIRRDIIDTMHALAARGLYTGTSGNISVRGGAGFFITPTGIPFDETKPSNIVEMTLEGKTRGPLLPSSEWHFHRDILRARGEVNAVIHTHAPFATTVSCLRRDVPSFHYMIAKAGGDSIRCARYATFGTDALSKNALKALKDRKACLLANHGMIALGPDLGAARRLAEEVEDLCGQYWRASLAGKPVILPRREMARVIEKFKTYGRQPGKTGQKTGR